jgi:hypothetical protein
MRFKALRHQPSDAARKSGYDNEGQLPDTLPDSRSRPGAAGRNTRLAGRIRLVAAARLRRRAMFKVPQQRFHRSVPQETGLPLEPVTWREETCETSGNGGFQRV